MASAALRVRPKCSVCDDIYIDRVSLKCGHNFCRECIEYVLDSQKKSGYYSCPNPKCRKRFKSRPTLQPSIALSSQPDQEVTRVLCDNCIHSSAPAVMHCLHCDVSLCDDHLRVHSKAPEHVLCDPTTSLKNRKCSVHNKILEYYCSKDAACVCVSCYAIGEHVRHEMMSLDEASKGKKKNLRYNFKKLMAETEKDKKRVQSLEERKTKAQVKADGEAKRVSALLRDLRRQLEELEERVLSDITRRVEQMSQSYDDVIRQLDIKKEELSRKMRHIKELCKMTDPLTVLQESHTGDLCDMKYRHDKQLHDGGDLDVAGISHTLHTGLADIMSGVTRIIYGQPTDILLEENTAGDLLHISDDRKTASRAGKKQNRPETAERFQYPQVLSSQSFSSGRHYWEVDVGRSDKWRVGMCYPSIAREGDQSLIGWSNKSWSLCRDDDQYSVIHDRKVIRLPDWIPSDRVRIYLDYEVGLISFYALCFPIIKHLHTYNVRFTGPLHAGFYVEKGCIKIAIYREGEGGERHPPTGDITGRDV